MDTINPQKIKPPAMVCILSNREASQFEDYGVLPSTCDQQGPRQRGLHRHMRRTKATLLVRARRYRWVGPHAKWMVEVRPKSWQAVVGASGYTGMQMVEGGIRA